MTYTISKDFHFSASHTLDGLDPDHPCGRLHGHNYLVRLEVTSNTLNDVGFVVDYGEFRGFSDWLDANLDHRHINDADPFNRAGAMSVPSRTNPDRTKRSRRTGNPTAENMARVLFGVAQLTVQALLPPDATIRVGVSETPKTWAWFGA